MSSPATELPAATQQDPAASGSAAPKKAPRNKKPKLTYMLHDPNTFASLGKYVSTDYRYAALKVASRGHKDIYLRKTNTKNVYQFAGDVVTLDTPQVIQRGERQITYTKKPTVRLVKKFVYTGPLQDDEEEKKEDAEAGKENVA